MYSAPQTGKCRSLPAERVKWQCQRKGTANERLVNIDLYIIDCFEMTVKSFNGSLRHIRCDQSFQRTRTSTVTLPLEELMNSMDLVNQVADMLIYADYGFTKFTERISKFIHKEASRLGPEYQMVRIIVKLDDITKLKFDEGFVLVKCATLGLETVEHNSSLGVDEDAVCPICLERLFMDDFTNNEAVIIMCAPCAHMFQRNYIETWLKKKRTCPYAVSR